MIRLGEGGYEVARATGRCAATGGPISPGERYIAALVERAGQEQLERLDFSASAWEEGARPRAPLRLFASWRAMMEEPGRPRRQLIDDDALLDIFEQLDGATEPGRVAFRYMLALILARKRLLRIEGSREGVMLLRRVAPKHAPPGQLYEVVDPGVDEGALAQATDELRRVLVGPPDVQQGAGE